MVCANSVPGCYNVTAVLQYACSVQKVFDSDTTFRQVLFEHQSSIVQGNGLRIKTIVLNPYFYTSNLGGVYV